MIFSIFRDFPGVISLSKLLVTYINVSGITLDLLSIFQEPWRRKLHVLRDGLVHASSFPTKNTTLWLPVFFFFLLFFFFAHPLRKHAYSNIKKISPPKTENFQVKNFDIFFLFLLKTKIVGTR